MQRRFVLASTSSYRAAVLRSADYVFESLAPEVDERAYDDRFSELGPDGYVLLLAEAKARSVATRLTDGLVLGCDQIAVLDAVGDTGPTLLHQPGTVDRAVAQLMSMSASTHSLINALVLIDVATGEQWSALDRHRVTMAAYDETEARRYVEQFQPLDCAGGYRIEDDAGLLASLEGEDRSGVIGLPLPTLERLLDSAGVSRR